MQSSDLGNYYLLPPSGILLNSIGQNSLILLSSRVVDRGLGSSEAGNRDTER